MSHLSVAAPASVIIAVILLLLFAGWLCVANWQRSLNRKLSGWLETLRFLLIALLGVTLLRPEFEGFATLRHAGNRRSDRCVRQRPAT